MNPEEQLRVYEQDKNAEANIRKIITDAYGGLKPEIEQVRYFENEAMPSFYNTFNGYGTGTSGSDLSPSQILQMASRNVANATTTGQVARDAFDIRRAGMEDLIGSGMRQWNTGYDMANNAYQRWWAQKQHEDQMALAREQMRRSGGGNQGFTFDPGDTSEDDAKIKAAYYAWVKDQNEKWNAGANVAWNKAQNKTNTTNKYFTPAPRPTVNSGSASFDGYINNFYGIK